MRTGNSIWGNPEVAIGCAGLVQMATYYGLPSNTYGISTSSKLFDEQVGYEKMMGGLVPVLAGSTMMTSAGMIEDGLTASLPQLVIDNEIYGMIQSIFKGVSVDDSTLAVGALRELVEKGQSTFLLSKHTRQNMRTAVYVPSISNRQSRVDWAAQGSKDVIQAAEDRVREILAKHVPTPMDSKLVQEIDGLVAAAETELTGEA
jgi:trimethylamine---corrinoid protein Co-methyltransferase